MSERTDGSDARTHADGLPGSPPSPLALPHRYLVGVDGLPLGLRHPRSGENALDDVVLPSPVFVDVGSPRTDMLLGRSVLVAKRDISSEPVALSQVIAKSQRTRDYDVGVGAGESFWFTECPSLRGAKFTFRLESKASSALDAALTCSSSTTMSQSMTGLAARPGTAVLPTCSMATTGTACRSKRFGVLAAEGCELLGPGRVVLANLNHGT